MRITPFILFCIFSFEVFSQDFDKKKMDAYFNQLDEKGKAMASVGIWKNEGLIYRRSIGYRDVELNIKSNDSTKYRIGSISKTFTAVILMQLMEEGKISMKTRLSEYFPKFTNADSISIEQMLRHESGLYNFTNSPAYLKWCTDEKSRQELIDYMLTMGVVFPAGERFQYSNTNYVLLSMIAESIEDKPYSEILADRIVKRLSLSNTYYGDKIKVEENEALSYSKLGRWDLNDETDLSIPLGAGGIVSNPNDLHTFYYALFNGKIISDSSLKTMMTLKDKFGIGLFTSPFHERTAIGHTGGIDAFASTADYFPEDSIYVTFNSNGLDVPMNDIMIGTLSILFDREYKIPSFDPLYRVSQKYLDKISGKYKCDEIGLEIDVFRIEDQLVAQATDQPAFPLQAFEKNKFQFKTAGVEMEFHPKKNYFILYQGGEELEFKLIVDDEL